MKKILIAIVYFLYSYTANAISITAFGAVGNGVTDNYYAFKMAAVYAAANPNTTITFPAGTFYIAKYRTVDNDTTDHIKWQNCVGLKLIGSTGTIISMNGAFFRPLDYFTSSCALKSYTTGLSPFYFINCTDLEIRNMEIKGNVQNTTRAPGVDENNPSVTEGSNILLRFTLCTNVVVDNMYLHHAESDGMMISGDRVDGIWTNSRNFTVSNVRSWNNCRQGMSIGGLTNGLFTSCEFSQTGFVGGTYGHNDPASGVDIEPGILHYVDSVKFYKCKFEGNYGGQFLSSAPQYTSNITLLKDTITVTGDEKPQGITILSRYSLVDSCFISLGNRDFKVTNQAKPGSTIVLSHNTIESTGNWIVTNSTDPTDSIIIRNNQFNYLGSIMSSNFITLQTVNLRFLNNNIYIPSDALLSRPTGTHVLVQYAIISSGNVFHSENPAINPRVDYTGTITVSDP